MPRLGHRAFVLAAAAGLVLVVARPADAQRRRGARVTQPAKAGPRGTAVGAPAKGKGGQAEAEPTARVERTRGGGKVIKLTPILVEGKVQKPLALVLARSRMKYEWEQLKKNFAPKIVRAVSRHPF